MSHCEGIGVLLAEKYLEAFHKFAGDLLHIQALYQQHKVLTLLSCACFLFICLSVCLPACTPIQTSHFIACLSVFAYVHVWTGGW